MVIRKKLEKSCGLLLAAAVVALGIQARVSACSDILLNNSGASVVSGRTMDLETDLKSELVAVSKGQNVQVVYPDGTKGISYESKYSFVGINALNMNTYCDGLNEKGLSAAFLWLEETKYPESKEYPGYKAIPTTYAIAWILGNFSSVKEVRQSLEKTIITGVYVDALKLVVPLHMVIHDRAGNTLFLEMVDGKVKMSENVSKVFTNDPVIEWQLINMINYQNSTNSGYFGGRGIPGDMCAPSRFVALTFLNKYVKPSNSDREAVQNCYGILNRVNVVAGEKVTDTGADYTQWTIVRDHKNAVLYYRTSGNQSIRMVDLAKINFKKGALLKLPLEDNAWVTNNTNLFK